MAHTANQLTLGAKDVHIWRASLEQTPVVVERLCQLLSNDELQRAERFHFEKDRKHFITARGCLRVILSRYLGVSSAKLRFSYGVNGKPRLVTSSAQKRTVYFNLAHSGCFALYALTCIGEIGVDVERIRPEFTGEDIAKRFFSPVEVASLNEVAAELRHEAFFNCWTRKEAFIKATGVGLSLSLDQFDVTLSPNEPAKLLRTRWDETEAARWSLKAIDVAPGYVAAVAVPGHDWQLTFSDVDEGRLL